MKEKKKTSLTCFAYIVNVPIRPVVSKEVQASRSKTALEMSAMLHYWNTNLLSCAWCALLTHLESISNAKKTTPIYSNPKTIPPSVIFFFSIWPFCFISAVLVSRLIYGDWVVFVLFCAEAHSCTPCTSHSRHPSCHSHKCHYNFHSFGCSKYSRMWLL